MSDERIRLLERRLRLTPNDQGALVSLALERDRDGSLTPGQSKLLAWCEVPLFFDQVVAPRCEIERISDQNFERSLEIWFFGYEVSLRAALRAMQFAVETLKSRRDVVHYETWALAESVVRRFETWVSMSEEERRFLFWSDDFTEDAQYFADHYNYALEAGFYTDEIWVIVAVTSLLYGVSATGIWNMNLLSATDGQFSHSQRGRILAHDWVGNFGAHHGLRYAMFDAIHSRSGSLGDRQGENNDSIRDDVLLPAIRHELALYAALGGAVEDPLRRYDAWLRTGQVSHDGHTRMTAAGLSRGEFRVLDWLELR